MTFDPAAYRDRFPILADTTYLVSHSLGAMPNTVFEEMQSYATTWATRGIRAWSDGWWDMPLAVGDELAPILGAPPRSVAMHQNVSICQALVLSCLEPTPERNRIVYSELEFPSVMYVYDAHARDGAIEVHKVPSADGMTVPVEAMLAAIDERTLLVPISHVLFKSAFLQDIARIVERAHEVGALVLLDTYQSAGTVPIDVTALDVDFATGGSVKWLCGGPGAGYLYVHPRHHGELQPKLTGWMAHAAPFAFEPEQRYADGIARFLHGSPAIPSLYAARSGYRIINEIGTDVIRAASLARTQRIIELADAADLTVTGPREADRRGGTVAIGVDDAVGGAVVAELERRGVLVDFRPGAGIRISPHFYTLDAEVDTAIGELADIVRTGAYDRAVTGAAY
ncbi:MAG: aminotransferase class V-fold PLP-dependent enzyme [Thermoleophilia bacterium]|nr:aminotransferase class V-fold PLP-dependent enzyme [Thermoleophilia bacterium]